jgi:bacterioferritin
MAQNQNFALPFNIDEIKRQAMHSVNSGALTEDYSLDVGQAVELLNSALATEIMCVLRYRHHQITARGIDYAEVADEFREHAENEEEHMLRIAERINQLGGDPDFNPATILKRSTTDFGTSADLITMIREDLVAERIAIEVYKKMISWFGAADPTTRRLLEDILEDEEEHANDLADFLISNARNSRDVSTGH